MRRTRLSCWQAGLAATACLALSGCNSLGYYAQAAHGQFSLLAQARPITEWLQDPATNPKLHTQLEMVQDIRQFSIRTLALPDNGSYRSYAQLPRPFVVWNVVAAPVLSLEARQWCFPIAGCVNYRGYYDQKEAQAYADGLAQAGDDVQVLGVPAYSTLGWFNDPVLSTFINYPAGEETQVVGALSELGQDEDVLIGLPGTHSKWVRVQGQRIVHFDTFMTGEVYAVLRRHAILGRTMLPGDHGDDVSFERGARVAISEQGQAGVLSTIFSSRTLGLTGELDGAAQAEYLSGVLIGHEIAALAATRQTAGLNPAPRIILIGDEQLCERYRKVLALHAMTTVNIAAAATEHGLWQIASQAGLLSSALPDKDTSC